MGDITVLLERARGGDVQARDRLFRALYQELMRLAQGRLARSAPVTQLDAPSLVHETYLRLERQGALPGGNRKAFFAYASGVMRSVLVDALRERQARKRGGGDARVTLVTSEMALAQEAPDVEALDEGLRRLARIDDRLHRIVEMRYFGGLSIEEIGEVLELSPATIKRDWQKARAFLYRALRGEP
jgi:RNA polymerase sigma factor (TIGR02999 family)